MGLIDNSPFSFKSGPTCTGTYIRVNTPIHCVMGNDGKYFAQGTWMRYYNQEARVNELDPMEIGDINLEIDPSGVFQVVFEGLKKIYTNCTDVIDPVIERPAPTEPALQSLHLQSLHLQSLHLQSLPLQSLPLQSLPLQSLRLHLLLHKKTIRSTDRHRVSVTTAIMIVAVLGHSVGPHQEVCTVASMRPLVIVAVASDKQQLVRVLI